MDVCESRAGMLAAVCAVAIVAAGCGAAMTSTGKVRSEYDRFDQTHNVILDDLRVRTGGYDWVDIRMIASTSDGFASVQFRTTSSDWRFLKCHSVDALADGKKVPLGETAHDGEVLKHGVFEYIRFSAPKRSVAQMARAQSLEARICSNEFAFKPDHIATIRRFYLAAWGE